MMDDTQVKEEFQSVKGKLEKEMEKTNQLSLKLFISIVARWLLKETTASVNQNSLAKKLQIADT